MNVVDCRLGVEDEFEGMFLCNRMVDMHPSQMSARVGRGIVRDLWNRAHEIEHCFERFLTGVDVAPNLLLLSFPDPSFPNLTDKIVDAATQLRIVCRGVPDIFPAGDNR